MAFLGAGWSCRPGKKLEFLADCHALWGNENPYRGRGGCSISGRFCGLLATEVLKFTVNDSLSGRLWAELFWVGDFYAEAKGDLATFLRVQMIFKF